MSELSPELEQSTSHWRQAGKIALAGSALFLAVGTPVAANVINSVADMDPTKVPVTIAGSTVEAELMPGNDVIKVEALGNAAIHKSDYHFGRKTVGLDIRFQTEDMSLATKGGTPDMAKLEAIARQFSDPTPQRHIIETAIKNDVRRQALTAGLETLGLEALTVGGFVLARRHLKKYEAGEERLLARDHKIVNALGVAGLGLVAVMPIAKAGNFYLSPNNHQKVVANQAFAGTAAEGWQVKGPFASFIDVSWNSLNTISSKKNAYYTALEQNFTDAFLEKYTVSQLKKPENTLRLIFMDDTQGMDGPIKVVGAAAEAFDVDYELVGGDTEDGDMPYVSVADRIRDEAKGRKVIMATGRHDPADIGKIAKERGFIIGNNEIQNVSGVSFLPVADASTLQAFTSKNTLIKQGYTNTDVTNTVINEACAATKPVIVLVHDNKIGTPIARANCPQVKLVLMGRSYVPPSPVNYGNTIAITSGSTGGHNFGEGINISGIISGKASFQIIDVDSRTLEFQRLITISMDPVPKLGTDTSTPSATVTISDPIYTLPSKQLLAEGKH